MDPSTDPLVASVTTYIKSYMSTYDPSHDYSHIQRVVRLSHLIAADHPSTSPPLNPLTIHLSALLHDVGDRKYLQPGQDPSTAVSAVLLSLGAAPDLAATVQAICSGVSYSAEVRDPERVRDLIARHPELAVVQDADRIDALGAVGIGRLFTYGAAKTDRGMDGSMGHVEEKLLRLEGMMKTEAGRRIARERTERLRVFGEWWADETGGGKTDGLEGR